ncbi:MAG: hypothetical protein IT302_04810 [Dehalococcoidia bacterium]|nr:hypothetical protein [Dehalococcoidia bacterium]
MTIKASALLAVIVIWAAIVPAVALQNDAWWALLFAFFATGAVASSFWRRLGMARVIGIAGAWAGAAIAIVESADVTWVSVLAFVATLTILYSAMRRDAILHGAAIAAVWLILGGIITVSEGGGAWTTVFAFLTTATLANSRGNARPLSAILWWGIAGGVIAVADGDFAWLAVIAFVLTASSVGFGDFNFPTGIEWDLFGRGSTGDEDEPFVRTSRAERRARRHAGWREFDTNDPESATGTPPDAPRRVVIVERDDDPGEVR